MADIERFINFIEEIAENGDWEYEDGESMTEDARAYIEQIERKVRAKRGRDE